MWSWEVVDAHGDVADQDVVDTLSECLAAAPATAEVALVKMEGNDDEGELDRSYAYVEDGGLPLMFEDGSFVPKRFHEQIGATR